MRSAIEVFSIGRPSSTIAAGDRADAAGERLEQFGAAGAHEPVEADDLAGADVERDLVDGEPARVGRVGDHEILDLEQLAA